MTTSKMPTRIKPAATWPNYDGDVARAELAAMDMLVNGISQSRVVRRTGLSTYRVQRLVMLLEEDSKKPPRPRNVCRHPRPRNAARITQPRTASAAAAQPTAATEPEQLALL
ncbi:hypothetical protein AB0H73_09595 [Streptomyces olivoreticuli]